MSIYIQSRVASLDEGAGSRKTLLGVSRVMRVKASRAKLFTLSRFDPAYSAPPPPPVSPEGGRDDIWIEGGRGGSAGGRGSLRPWILPMSAGRGGSANGTESTIVGFTEDNIGTEAARPCGLRANANEEAARPCDMRANACAKHSSEICAPSTSSTDSDLEIHKISADRGVAESCGK
jgi:hypothetical protein